MMDAGRELDALVAEKVMGWQRVSAREPYFWPPVEAIERLKSERPDLVAVEYLPAPTFSTDIAAAWRVVERMNGHGFEIYYDPVPKMWRAAFVVHNWHNADTAPLAICRAALAEVELTKGRVDVE